jgi:murein DD-endopeptidase MepM/ murein hydrolase activator NlpD
MSQNKFIYDPNLLTYNPIDNSLKQKFKNSLPFLIIGFVVGIMSYTVLAVYYVTPKEKLYSQQIIDIKSRQLLLTDRIKQADQTLEKLIAKDDSLYRTMLGEKVISSAQRMAGTGGVNKYGEMTNANTPNEIIQSFQELDNLIAKMNVQEGSYRELFSKAMTNFDRMQHLPAIIPIANWDLKRVGSGFSPRRFHPILKTWRQHEGIDFVAPKGTKVFASADGVVKSVRYSSSFGKVIVIDHGYEIKSLYAHLSKFKVKKGSKVKRGQVIGYVGNTGLSGGPHLHYEVHVNKKEVDPTNYFFNDLTAEEYKGIVTKAQSVEICME